MESNIAQILSHIPNSGIVQLPGRRFPGIIVQGDTLSGIFDGVRYLLMEFKKARDEERYFEMLLIAEQLQGQLIHYEATLAKQKIDLPYTISVHDRLVKNDYSV